MLLSGVSGRANRSVERYGFCVLKENHIEIVRWKYGSGNDKVLQDVGEHGLEIKSGKVSRCSLTYAPREKRPVERIGPKG